MKRKATNVPFYYNCSTPLTPENRTSEHIPARTLFRGVEEEKRQNLLTVPGCKSCNETFALTDGEIRDVIAMSNDNIDELVEFGAAAARGLVKTKGFTDRIKFEENSKLPTIEFSYKKISDTHLKNFKGIFVEEFGVVMPNDLTATVVMDGDGDKNIEGAAFFYKLLISDSPEWQYSGHPDIFKYLISGYSVKGKTSVLEVAIGVVAVMIYHKKVFGIVNATTKDLQEEVKKKFLEKKATVEEKSERIIDYNNRHPDL